VTAGSFTKAAGAKLDYTLDVRKKIAPHRVFRVDWRTDDPALIIGNGTNGMPAPSNTEHEITVWLTGGRPGHTHIVTAMITTPDGHVYDEEFGVQIKGEAAPLTVAAETPVATTPLRGITPPTTAELLPLAGQTLGVAALLVPALWVTGRALKLPLTGWRLIGAAFIGAVGGVFLWRTLRRPQ